MEEEDTFKTISITDDELGEENGITSDNQKTQNADALQTVLNYYLSGEDISAGYQELGRQVFLALVSLSGAGLYIFPALKFAKERGEHGNHYAGQTLIARQINYATCTSIPALAVLYNATDMFLTVRHSEQMPKKLKNYLVDSSSKCKRRVEDIVIVLGAAISAVPLVFVSLNYPIPLATEALKIIQPAVIEIDNTILHFLPLKLAMTMPLYRFPILPFEYAIKALCCRTEGTDISQNKNTTAELNRQQLIQYIQQVQNQLYFRNKWGFYVFNWSFKPEFKQCFQSDATLSIQDLFKEFPIDGNWTPAETHIVHERLGQMVGLISSLWIAGGCAGYLLETVNDILALMGNNVALSAIMATPSVYFLTVLLTFFGYTAGKDLYHYAISWGENEPKLPLEFKLYPKTFTLSMIATLYIALHSYAAAEQLIHDSFQGEIGEQLKPYFLWFARTSLSFLSISAMKDFLKTTLRKWAMYMGDEDTYVAARLQTILEQLLMSAVNRIKPEILVPIADLALQTKNQKSGNTFGSGVEIMKKKSPGFFKSKAICCFFPVCNKDETDPLLDDDNLPNNKTPIRCGIL